MGVNYKYRIVEKTKCHFELLPNNNNDQYVAKSDEYDSYDECFDALARFKNFMASTKNIPYSTQKDNKKHWYGYFLFSGNEKIFTRAYEQKSQVKKGIERIKNNYSSDLRTDL